MGKKFEEKEKEEYPVTSQEVQDYAAAIKQLPQYRFDGQLISSRERYLIQQGSMRMENGEMVVVLPTNVTRINKIDMMIPREKFTPQKEWYEDIRRKINVIEARVIHGTEEHD